MLLNVVASITNNHISNNDFTLQDVHLLIAKPFTVTLTLGGIVSSNSNTTSKVAYSVV